MKVIIAGGGTAGHINPGIAIAKKIKEKHPEASILFIGTERGLEKTLVPKEGFDISFITVKGFQRKLSLDTLKTVKALFQGLGQARKVIKDFNPDVVIGTGGYVCGPVVFQATTMKIPTMIHEQNAYPSMTNRILSKFVDAIAISFEGSRKFFTNTTKVTLTGNPIRPELFTTGKALAMRNLGFTNEKPVLLVFGGSQGAQKINQAMVEILDRINENNDLQLLFAPGPNNYDSIMNEIHERHIELHNGIQIVPYIYNMNEVMRSTDFAVVRAGALTIAELTALGIPGIYIPLPSATNNHQFHNAKALEAVGGCVVIEQKDLTPEVLYNQIYHFVNHPELLQSMSKGSRTFGILDADEKIYQIILNLLRKS